MRVPRPVVILQIGDSHTANDSFSGRLRELFQARFGDAGRGVLPPGVPYRYYRPARVTVTSEGWSVVSSYRGDPGPFGITGLRQHADGPAEMTLVSRRSRRPRSRRDRGSAPAGRRHARCRTGTGRPCGDCHGGADPAGGVAAGAVLAGQPHADAARARRRAGGRAGMERHARPARRDLRQPRHRIRRRRSDGRLGPAVAAPGPHAPVAVADRAGVRHQRGLPRQHRSGGICHRLRRPAARVACRRAAAPRCWCLGRPTPTATAARAAPRRPPATIRTGPSRRTSPRSARRSAASRRAKGAYFWDWQAAMGGPCSMLRWAATNPPMAAPGPCASVRARLSGDRRGAVPRDHGRLRTLPRDATRGLMLFPTLDFLLFFIVVLALMVPLARAPELRKLALVAASYFFYAQWNWHYCLLLAGSSLLTYVGGIGIGAASSQRTRKLIVGVTVAMHLLLLSTFKYLDFLVGSANHLLQRIRHRPRAAVHGDHSCRSASRSSRSTASRTWSMSIAAMSRCAGGRSTSCCICRSSRSLSPARSCARRSSCRSLPGRPRNACRSPSRCC